MIAQSWALLDCAGVLLAGAAYGAGTLLCVCAVERAPTNSGGAAVMLVTAAFRGAAVISFLGAGILAASACLCRRGSAPCLRSAPPQPCWRSGGAKHPNQAK